MAMIIQIIGFLLVGVPVAISLYLHYKQRKLRIETNLVRGRYDTSSENGSESNKFEAVLDLNLHNNSGRYVSVSNVILRIGYSPEALDVIGKSVNFPVFSTGPRNYHEVFPIELKPHGSERVKLQFKFENIFPFGLARFQRASFMGWLGGKVPLLFAERVSPKEREKWKELSVLAEISVVTPEKKIFTLLISLDSTRMPDTDTVTIGISPLKKNELDKEFLEKRLK